MNIIKSRHLLFVLYIKWWSLGSMSLFGLRFGCNRCWRVLTSEQESLEEKKRSILTLSMFLRRALLIVCLSAPVWWRWLVLVYMWKLLKLRTRGFWSLCLGTGLVSQQEMNLNWTACLIIDQLRLFLDRNDSLSMFLLDFVVLRITNWISLGFRLLVRQNNTFYSFTIYTFID